MPTRLGEIVCWTQYTNKKLRVIYSHFQVGVNVHMHTANRHLQQNMQRKHKGQISNTHPCEVNGANVAATSPASLLSSTGAMADTPLVQTNLQGRKAKEKFTP